MSASACAQHAGVAATYRCDGCERLLCTECTREGHALLFCKLCGERALPLAGAGGAATVAGAGAPIPATVRERRRLAAVSRPYSLAQALTYPFRGMGLYLFIATLISTAVVTLLSRGLTGGIVSAGFAALLTALQFKIVRTTAEGENELPDWPELEDWGERFFDFLTLLFVALLQLGPAALYLWLRRGRLFSLEPDLGLWAGFAVLYWLGVALGLMAFGAAGRFNRGDALRLDLHVRGFLAGGADAIAVTNLTFGLGVLFFVLRAALSALPLVGAAVSGIVGTYWLFTSAHLAGVLFRRHVFQLEKLYPVNP